MTAMIISFADTPQVVQEFTNNRRLLRERLATIEPTVRGTDLHGALELADGLANPNRMPLREGDRDIDVVEAQKATVYIVSDGRFEAVKGFSLGKLEAVLRADWFARREEPGDHGVLDAAERIEAGREAGVCAGGELYDGGAKGDCRT